MKILAAILSICVLNISYGQNTSAYKRYEADSMYIAFYDVVTDKLYGEIQLAGTEVAVMHNPVNESFLITYLHPKDNSYSDMLFEFVKYDSENHSIVIVKDQNATECSINNEILNGGQLSISVQGVLIEERYLIMYLINGLNLTK